MQFEKLLFKKTRLQIIEMLLFSFNRKIFSYFRNLTVFTRRALLITALKAVWLQAASLPVITVVRRATNKRVGGGICSCSASEVK